MSPTGVLMVVAGAILYWAVDANIPRVDDDPLGVILMVAGVVLAAVSTVLKSERAVSGVSAGVVLIALGAILYWAVDLDLPYIIDDAMAAILAVVGAGAAVMALVSDRRLTGGRDGRDRVVGEGRGGSESGRPES